MSFLFEYRDRAGNLIDSKTYKQLREDVSYRLVATTKVGEPPHQAIVSTIWTGFDTQGQNHIFETRVIETDTGGMTVEEYGWKTEGQAIQGHKQVVRARKLLY